MLGDASFAVIGGVRLAIAEPAGASELPAVDLAEDESDVSELDVAELGVDERVEPCLLPVPDFSLVPGSAPRWDLSVVLEVPGPFRLARSGAASLLAPVELPPT